MVFYYKFLDPNIERNDINIDRTRVYHQVSDLLEQINASIGFLDSLKLNEGNTGSSEDYDLQKAFGEIKLLCDHDRYKKHNADSEHPHDDEGAEEEEEVTDALLPRFRKLNLPCKEHIKYKVPFPVIAGFKTSGIDGEALRSIIAGENSTRKNYTGQVLQIGGGSLIVDLSSHQTHNLRND